jgi:hypothetical protein
MRDLTLWGMAENGARQCLWTGAFHLNPAPQQTMRAQRLARLAGDLAVCLPNGIAVTGRDLTIDGINF